MLEDCTSCANTGLDKYWMNIHAWQHTCRHARTETKILLMPSSPWPTRRLCMRKASRIESSPAKLLPHNVSAFDVATRGTTAQSQRTMTKPTDSVNPEKWNSNPERAALSGVGSKFCQTNETVHTPKTRPGNPRGTQPTYCVAYVSDFTTSKPFENYS